MRIYLDTNIYRVLKNSDNSDFLTFLKGDKERNVYYFSEAHLQDLARDKSDQKFSDMDFMEEICGRNCYSYDEKIQYSRFSPAEYYDRFEWPSIDKESKGFLDTILESMKLVPLRFGDYIDSNNLPEDFPKEFEEMLNKSITLFDYFHSFLDFTIELSAEQRKFRDFLKYLHSNSHLGSIYEYFQIYGYDGVSVVDRPEFNKSFIDFVCKTSTLKDMYNIFMLMYNSLEIFGFVKGIPKKQKMMNLINDSRHSYFGSFSDIVVSEDSDFRKKCVFLYDVLDLNISVFSFFEFKQFITNERNFVFEFDVMLDFVTITNSEKYVKVLDENHRNYLKLKLDEFIYGYFDTVYFFVEEGLSVYCLTKDRKNFSHKAIQPELEFLTKTLVDQLGNDNHDNGYVDCSDFQGDEWNGRYWVFDLYAIQLFMAGKLFLKISFLYEGGVTNPS